MAVAPGTRFGPYDVVAPLGAGGMGEVYRARDPRLGRDVAIKILPASFAADATRLARFDREARVLASLNHPHIAAIYGIEEAGAIRALVLEFVDGQTLAARVAGGRSVPIDETLALARQIADALDAAHERGIVHRDLKPANIIVTPAGTVKVLDFGLAKGAVDGEASGADDLTHSPTIMTPTVDGVLLGTAGYMSPEQARGKSVDKRADIWAFGCVVYEMITGRQAFPGETVSDHIAAILGREPDWSALPATTPAPLVRLMRRCLEKDPRRRLRDIGDARFEFEAALSGSGSPSSQRRGSNPWRVAAGGSALVALGLAAALTYQVRDSRRTQTPSGISIAATQLTHYGIAEASGTLSPDGRSFAFTSDHAGTPDIWLRQITGGELIRLTSDDAEETETVFAPDGESIFYSRIDTGGYSIWRVGAFGGQPRKVISRGRMPSPSPDGRYIAYYVPSGSEMTLVVSMLDGSSTRSLVPNLPGGFLNVRAAWTPDSHALSYVTSGLFAPKNLMRVDAATGQVRQLTHFTRALEGIGQHVWLPDGHHLIVAWSGRGQQGLSDLAVLDVDDESLRRLTVAVDNSYAPTSLSGDGSRLLATASNFNRELWRVPFGPDPDGNGRMATRVLDAAWNPLWTFVSRDEETVLFNSPINGSRNLWTASTSFAARPRQITALPESAVSHSSLSPDGSRVAFASVVSGASEIWMQSADGSGLRQLTTDSAPKSWPVWSPDGDRLVFNALRDSRNETWVLDVATGRAEKLRDGFFRGDWIRRPDGGTWIVTTREASGIAEMIDGQSRRVVWTNPQPITGTGMPMFSPDSRLISTAARESRDHDVIWVLDATTGAARLAARLPFHVSFRASWIDHGTAFLVNKEQLESHVVLFDRVWQPAPRP